MPRKPAMEARQRLRAEPLLINGRELPYEWHYRHVSHSRPCSAQLAKFTGTSVQLGEKLDAPLPITQGVAVVALRIFVPVEIMFELSIVTADQFGVVS